MTTADTPMPGEDPGALIEDPARLDELEPETEVDIESNPQPQPADDDRAAQQAAGVSDQAAARRPGTTATLAG